MNTILTPASRAENDPQRDSPRTRQRRRPHHLRPQQRPYTILRGTGKKSPQCSVETRLRLRTATAERAPRNPPGPRRLGHGSTALDGVCVDASTPPGNTFCTKGSSGTCSACKGHRPCIKAGATKRALLTREYSLHCCIRGQMHKGCRGALRPARRNCRQTVRCEVRRYSWSVS